MNGQNCLVLFILIISTINVLAEEAWKGKWFPLNPNENAEGNNVTSSDKWTGKWFPNRPDESQASTKDTRTNDAKYSLSLDSSENKIDGETQQQQQQPRREWKSDPSLSSGERVYEYDRIMGIPNKECDDGKTNLETDFDPSETDHALKYTCLETSYKPNFSLEPIQTIYDVPTFYTPVHKCMNETITYDQHIPTLGYHRPLWPKYGEYSYLPPQRWLHSLEHGGIGFLYNPCANQNEIYKLKQLVKKCLYRHIITPYELTKERPLALVAWGTSLELGAVDETVAVEFIKKYAKSGPEKTSRQGQYDSMLIEEAKIVSDVDDSQLCPDVTVM